jgi:hypothetical protein
MPDLPIANAHDFGMTKVTSYLGSTDEFLLSYQFGNTKKRLDQHEKDIEDLKTRQQMTENQAKEVKTEVGGLGEAELNIHDSLVKAIYDMGPVKATMQEERMPVYLPDPIKEPSSSSGAYLKRLRQLQKYSNTWVLKLK